MTPSHHVVVAAFFLVLGCSVGSFLNVCIYRIPIGLSLLRPRSRCPHCRAAILLRDNTPVLGWLLLGGKCRQCRSSISSRYPLIEFMVGSLFAGCYLAEVALAPCDLWEVIGPLGVLLLNLLSWVLIGFIVVRAAMAIDARAGSRGLPLGRGIRGEHQAKSRCELV